MGEKGNQESQEIQIHNEEHWFILFRFSWEIMDIIQYVPVKY